MIHYIDSYESFKKSALLKTKINPGDYICLTDENRMYIYTENGNLSAVELNSNEGINISLYDLNKQIMLQMPSMSKEEIINKIEEFDSTLPHNTYYMLLNHEQKYFTVFQREPWGYASNFSDLSSAVLDCLSFIGEIKTVENYEDRCEIWIRINNEVFDFILFNYDRGVVTFGG